MRFAIILGILAAFLTVLPGLLSAEHVIDDSNNPKYLFTLSSTSGAFDGSKLTLKGVPVVVYFSDRPARKAGHISLEEFIGLWKNGQDSFKDDPPNAELSLFNNKSDKHAVIILRNPQVKGDSISFEVKIISEAIPEEFEHSTLFIDVGIGMSGSGTF